jgi:hypothetical protein
LITEAVRVAQQQTRYENLHSIMDTKRDPDTGTSWMQQGRNPQKNMNKGKRCSKTVDEVCQTLTELVTGLRSDAQGINFESIKVTVSKHRWKPCSSSCLCVCHIRSHWATPPLLRKVFGSMFVGYAGVPVFAPKCNRRSCAPGSFAEADLTYILPRWLFLRAVSMALTYTSRDGPQFNIRSCAVRSGSDLIFYYAAQGNVAGIHSLLKSGQASPFDVTPSGFSALYVRQSLVPSRLCWQGNHIADSETEPSSMPCNTDKQKCVISC